MAARFVLQLVKYVEQKLHLQLQTLVADYVKDASGRWWLLQVKAFRVKHKSHQHHHPDRPFSLPVKTRIQYLSYRDSSVLEDNSGSEDEDGEHSGSHKGHSLVALAQRQVQKLVQCKCCMASYPKSELSFKMTLKMISETLVRIRARLAPEKSYAFLAAALSCEPPDSSLAYESWSVCSFCYAIYERDQQLKRVETKFSAILGMPNPTTAAEGLSRVSQDRTYALDPNSIGSVLPPQLTLCRLVLVFNAIYDIPKELYDAEQTHLDHIPVGARKNKTLRTIASKLYLRVTALGYTECIPLAAEDIEIASDKAPRGASLRKASSIASDLEAADETTGEQFPETNATNDDGFLLSPDQKNYWLPINIIRTIHFVAPRTPLQSKLKETSGITSLLTEESSIIVQFIRATEPPLQDPTTVKRRTKKRRVALIPEVASVSEMVSEMQLPHHSVLLGSTKIRLAQFRSAYVTKIDFYACMALSGEMFNIKGNIGLERLRYVDSKFLTSQYRLRMFHGVFIPDDSYMTSDPLSPEWMDSLRVSFHKQSRVGALQPGDVREDDEGVGKGRASPQRHRPSKPGKQQLGHSKHQQASHTRSTTSLSNGDNDEMDEELEEMIERANLDQQQALAQPVVAQSRNQDLLHEPSAPGEIDDEAGETLTTTDTHHHPPSIAELKHELLPSTKLPSRFDSQISMLLKKAVLSPRSALADVALSSVRSNDNGSLLSASSSHHQSQSPLSPRNARRLWCLLVLLNEAHNLQSREHAFCRWECHYTLLGQKRSAVERHITSSSSTQVHFTCTHKFFVAGTAAMMQAFLKSSPLVSLHLRNDMYASTRVRSKGEFTCQLNLSPLLQKPSVETTIDIHPTNPEHATLLTPREAAAIAKAAPYLSVAAHLSQLALDPEDATATGDFLELSTTKEGLQVLRKIS